MADLDTLCIFDHLHLVDEQVERHSNALRNIEGTGEFLEHVASEEASQQMYIHGVILLSEILLEANDHLVDPLSED